MYLWVKFNNLFYKLCTLNKFKEYDKASRIIEFIFFLADYCCLKTKKWSKKVGEKKKNSKELMILLMRMVMMMKEKRQIVLKQKFFFWLFREFSWYINNLLYGVSETKSFMQEKKKDRKKFFLFYFLFFVLFKDKLVEWEYKISSSLILSRLF